MSTTQINSNKRVKKLPIFEDEKDLLSYLERSLTDNLKQFIRVSVSTMVKAEMEQIRSNLPDQTYFNVYWSITYWTLLMVIVIHPVKPA